MKHTLRGLFALTAMAVALGGLASAAALGSTARSVIPSEVQQIIAVDYRQVNNSPTALALKNRVLPEPLKQLETAMRGIGILPERDIEQLTFASFRTPSSGLRIVGIAQGQFSTGKVLPRIKKQKIVPTKYRKMDIYPMAGSMVMTFLDQWTMLFGQPEAVKAALRTREGEMLSLNSNNQMTDMMAAVEQGAVWSVLDAPGTQFMMKQALGEAAQLADYEVVKKRLLGSRYAMEFTNGVDFNLNVMTADTFTAATLSSLVKAGMLYKRMNANAVEKQAMEALTVDSDAGKLNLHFKTDDKKFEALLQSDLFASVAR